MQHNARVTQRLTMPIQNLTLLVRRSMSVLLLAGACALAQTPAPAADAAASSPSLSASPALATPASAKPPVLAPVPPVQANPYGLRALWEQGLQATQQALHGLAG